MLVGERHHGRKGDGPSLNTLALDAHLGHPRAMSPPPLFHGTSATFALAIVGPPVAVDVSRGDGEFGVGFYCGTSKGLAGSWVANRFRDPAIVEVSVSAHGYGALDELPLNDDQARAVRQRARAQKGILLNVDVVVGPIESRGRHHQYKFESAAAQGVLNGPETVMTRVA